MATVVGATTGDASRGFGSGVTWIFGVGAGTFRTGFIGGAITGVVRSRGGGIVSMGRGVGATTGAEVGTDLGRDATRCGRWGRSTGLGAGGIGIATLEIVGDGVGAGATNATSISGGSGLAVAPGARDNAHKASACRKIEPANTDCNGEGRQRGNCIGEIRNCRADACPEKRWSAQTGARCPSPSPRVRRRRRHRL